MHLHAPGERSASHIPSCSRAGDDIIEIFDEVEARRPLAVKNELQPTKHTAMLALLHLEILLNRCEYEHHEKVISKDNSPQNAF
eukprot:768820-Hanusia_phi.AAC.4